MRPSRARPPALRPRSSSPSPRVAGCGGDDVEKNNAYVDQVNLAQTQFASSFDAPLARDHEPRARPAQDRKTLRGIEAAIDATVADLRAIKPPDKVKALHGELVDAIAGYGDAIGAAESEPVAARRREATRAEAQLAADTARTSTQVTAAIAAINQKLRE